MLAREVKIKMSLRGLCFIWEAILSLQGLVRQSKHNSDPHHRLMGTGFWWLSPLFCTQPLRKPHGVWCHHELVNASRVGFVTSSSPASYSAHRLLSMDIQQVTSWLADLCVVTRTLSFCISHKEMKGRLLINTEMFPPGWPGVAGVTRLLREAARGSRSADRCVGKFIS